MSSVPSSKSEEGGWMETIRTVVYAVLIALVMRTFAYEPFSIPSGSMLPTLEIGDYLFVSKYSYGYSKHSFPFSAAPIEGRILGGKQPVEQGDVIVFKLPSDNSTDYIKRAIGLPGDTVQVIRGRLYINGRIVKRKEVGKLTNGYQTVTQYEETLPNGVKHMIWENADTNAYDNTRLYTVPEGHYFFMGDNRDNSLDSRAKVGFVPLENLVGRADVIFFSHNDQASLFQPWTWPAGIRWERLFNGID
ncbi:signal peptidase I [Rhodovibrionaceae bacterium A322]